MANSSSVAIGLDVGTGGARALAMNFHGDILAEGRSNFDPHDSFSEHKRVEQSPAGWRRAARDALRQVTGELPDFTTIEGVAVDATSGTFLLVDSQQQPLTGGIMYNDQRAQDVSQQVAQTIDPILAPFGIHIAPAFALPKILHILKHNPALLSKTSQVVHQTDWVVGMLTGQLSTTDISTALKTGANPASLDWPVEIEELGLPLDRLPQVVLPGTRIGEVTTSAAAETGIPAGTAVIAGCTDGTAGCLASGARATGDLNVTLGTTLVFKAIAEEPLIDPAGALYNHRHPAGGFLPGAASSTGAEWIDAWFQRDELNRLSASANRQLPTRRIAYPLMKTGERFPFADSDAIGFGLESIDEASLRLAAGMEAVAMLERMAIERFEQLGLPIGPVVYATGGGVVNETWLRIRAAVNRRTYSVPAHTDCAIGAAILAATPALGSCRTAITQMVTIDREIDPEEKLAVAYDAMYEQFRDSLRQRGWC
jgi:sugar (pentulose or hexulose) kinase